MEEAVIRLSGVVKRFGTEDAPAALDGIDLEIRRGEVFGIIGLSGAGKSTLVRCINLLERPNAGSVVVNGRDMTALSERELRKARREIGMIFQSFNLFMQRTALENVCFPMELAGTARARAVQRARELLEVVGLQGREDAYPAQLSGGQKQRVAIARTLASQPKVLLCDEATSALDPKTTRDILRLIQDINRKTGITVVIITHEMKVIEEICSRVAILDNGRVAETDAVEEVFSHPKSEAGRRLVYPDGVACDMIPKGRVVRVAFNGAAAYQPLVASLAIDCGVRANILGADLRNIDGRAFGTMLLSLPDNPDDAARALAYIRGCEHITAEEAQEYHA